MKRYFTQLIGRFGNKMFQYAHARALAEKEGGVLVTPAWEGEQIFEIPIAARPTEGESPLGGYRQTQDDLIYTRRQLKNWFTFKLDTKERLDQQILHTPTMFHFRRGDYKDLGYPVVSSKSYDRAAKRFKMFEDGNLGFAAEESPFMANQFEDMPWLPDFYRLMTCDNLFRANSSFSWWAGALGDCRVFSPVIDGLGRGEHDCNFIEGNYPKISDQFTDLHLFDESQRYDYDLNPDSVVIDAGAHTGRFSETIHNKYGCRVFAFEPFEEFQREFLKCTFRDPDKVELVIIAIGGDRMAVKPFFLKGDSSGAYADHDSVRSKNVRTVTVDIAMAARQLEQVDLLKLNVEGMEFEILEDLLAKPKTLAKIRNIQVQFHRIVPEADSRYAKIREGLVKTHRLTFDEPWCWQNFERRK